MMNDDNVMGELRTTEEEEEGVLKKIPTNIEGAEQSNGLENWVSDQISDSV